MKNPLLFKGTVSLYKIYKIVLAKIQKATKKL
ncbi:MAG: hypothetical protein JWP37_1669 [Mucilaginibacter sp.]|nr:hypothetical protein [Mucilaginibacter sp.]